MFYRFVVRALLLLVLLTAVLPTHASTKAQYQFDPIILNMDGDLWSWQGPDQPLVQLTDWNMNYQPIMSPDGTRVAYTFQMPRFMPTGLQPS